MNLSSFPIKSSSQTRNSFVIPMTVARMPTRARLENSNYPGIILNGRPSACV